MVVTAVLATFLADGLSKWGSLMLLVLIFALFFFDDSESYPPSPSCFNCKNCKGLSDSLCFKNICIEKIPYPYVKDSKNKDEIDKARYNASKCLNYKF